MAKMVTESGVATLLPVDYEVRRRDGSQFLVLTGESAQYAVEALGRKHRLFIDGEEVMLDEVRLRKFNRE